MWSSLPPKVNGERGAPWGAPWRTRQLWRRGRLTPPQHKRFACKLVTSCNQRPRQPTARCRLGVQQAAHQSKRRITCMCKDGTHLCRQAGTSCTYAACLAGAEHAGCVRQGVCAAGHACRARVREFDLCTVHGRPAHYRARRIREAPCSSDRPQIGRIDISWKPPVCCTLCPQFLEMVLHGSLWKP